MYYNSLTVITTSSGHGYYQASEGEKGMQLLTARHLAKFHNYYTKIYIVQSRKLDQTPKLLQLI